MIHRIRYIEMSCSINRHCGWKIQERLDRWAAITTESFRDRTAVDDIAHSSPQIGVLGKQMGRGYLPLSEWV